MAIKLSLNKRYHSYRHIVWFLKLVEPLTSKSQQITYVFDQLLLSHYIIHMHVFILPSCMCEEFVWESLTLSCLLYSYQRCHFRILLSQLPERECKEYVLKLMLLCIYQGEVSGSSPGHLLHGSIKNFVTCPFLSQTLY